ncbi:aminodeoxychorismate lyase [Chitinimonas arctica]|uniref:aminodeoxychorismate lyase n=1 Tax=Chitinimonas arctica TaxID=2594795 RepID=A0A516SIB0_9NEIS|nr:aminodeoxychorismate lyase [Chitinimonas arctica]QDQ27891.1 aminodeoxychorismate lyase [Chitinimonas arctica]
MHDILVDGIAPATVSPRDRGLAYGDGVFRTLRCQEGRLLAWPRHYRKLQADCAVLGLDCPSEARWLADIAQLAPTTAAIKLTVTRGVGARGYACDPAAPVTRLVQAGPLPDYSAVQRQGARVRLCDWLLGSQPGLAGVKHLNRLDQVMARREWQDPTIFDGLMRNGRDELVEGVISNVFLLRGDCLLTHPLTDCGVAGVLRELVLEVAAAQGLQVLLQAFDLTALTHADALLLSNSLAGVLPVAQCGSMSWHDFRIAERLNLAISRIAFEESLPCSPA